MAVYSSRVHSYIDLAPSCPICDHLHLNKKLPTQQMKISLRLSLSAHLIASNLHFNRAPCWRAGGSGSGRFSLCPSRSVSRFPPPRLPSGPPSPVAGVWRSVCEGGGGGLRAWGGSHSSDAGAAAWQATGSRTLLPKLGTAGSRRSENTPTP